MSQNGWRKSSRSGDADNCVEARGDVAGFQVRDSKLGEESPVLKLGTADFASLLRLVER
ncbi:DUF397 domain-containing protein [Glycomyces albidus]|uniref:DUF397 domain-containing protein n=1 Tax=Glycomyces albidus TaxID=2656774 RepID=A0A6L5GGQ9_9ACTN|nr:DUF397 domain-containing protein [Glycomyces albidus]MQM28908.1 DUF397 domain-containing protein [Glycomyces albidus]